MALFDSSAADSREGKSDARRDARLDVHRDKRLDAPATARNRDAILAILQTELPPSGRVLEISSGTGQHAVYFAPRLAPRLWQPSEPNPMSRESILAWAAVEPADNLLPVLDLDVMRSPWPLDASDPITAIVNINMIHIAPWEACLALLAGAGRLLSIGGVLYMYGPYRRQGQHTVPSNVAFDHSLRSRNPAWGIRDLEAVVAEAEGQGLRLHRVVDMPANNLSVIFHRVGA